MRTILLIEDDPDVRDNMQDLLMAEDYLVIATANGREGLKQAHLRQPDLIICDVMMPDVDGYAVLHALRTEPDTMTIPFVFVTAKASRADQRAGMDLGADDYLVKPFTSEELLQTVRTRLERSQAQSHWYQQRIERLRSNLSRTLPHEFRTPLSCILGYSEFLLEICDTVEPEELRSMLEEIQASGQRLERLVENYYLYAQLEISATDPVWRSSMISQGLSHPNQIVAQVAGTVAENHQRAADLQVNLAEGIARIQDVYLEKMIEALVDNAFKFSESGTPVRVVGLKEEDFYVLEVSDQGRGMAEEQLRQVGAFVQFDRDQYEQQGLGLGLSIARRLAELHQGTLHLESTPDEGTTVWIWLPLAD